MMYQRPHRDNRPSSGDIYRPHRDVDNPAEKLRKEMSDTRNHVQSRGMYFYPWGKKEGKLGIGVCCPSYEEAERWGSSNFPSLFYVHETKTKDVHRVTNEVKAKYAEMEHDIWTGLKRASHKFGGE